MPLSARELMVIVSAQDRASGVLRRLAGSMRGLSALEANRVATARKMSQLEAITPGGRRYQAALDERARAIQRAGIASSALASKQRQLIDLQKQYGRAVMSGAVADQRASQAVRRKVADLQTQIMRQTAALQSAAMSGNMATKRLSDMGKQSGVLRRELRGLGKEARQIRWSNFEAGARAVRNTGRALTYAGAVGAVALGVTAKAAADFETSMSLVATQTGRAGESITKTQRNAKALGRAVIPMMREFPASAQDMSDSLYEFFSSTTQGKKGAISLAGGIKLLRLANKAAVGGQADLSQATDAMVTVMNNFGVSVDEMPRVLNRMFAAVRFGKTTFGEFGESLKSFAPAAKNANQSLDDTVATFAFLTTRLGPAFARTGMMRLLEIFQRQDFVAGLKTFGYNAKTAAGNLKPLPQLITELVAKFPFLEKGGVRAANFFKEITAATGGRGMAGTAQARRAFQVLVSGLKEYQKTTTDVKSANNEFEKSFAVLAQTAGVKFGVFMNTLKSFALTIGQAVIPALNAITPYIQRFTDWFEGLDASTRDTVVRFAAIASGIALLVGALGMLSGSVLGIVGLFGRLGMITPLLLAIGAAVLVLTGHFDSLGEAASTAMDFFTGSWQGAAAGIALVIAAVLRLRSAMMGLSMAGAAGAGGGLLPMLFGKPGAMRAGIQSMRQAGGEAAIVANRFRLMRGLGASAAQGIALMPGPLKLVGAALGAAALAAGLWELHQRKMAQEAARMQAAINPLVLTLARMRTQADLFGRTGTDIMQFERAKDQAEALAIQIRQLQREINKAPEGSDRRRLLELQMNELLRQRAETLAQVRQSYSRLAASAGAFAQTITREANVTRLRAATEKELAQELQNRQRILRQIQAAGGLETARAVQPGLVRQLRESNAVIMNLRGSLKAMVQEQTNAGRALSNSWGKYIRQLKDMGKLPRTFTPAFARMGLEISKQLGRALSPAQLKRMMGALKKIQMGVEVKPGDIKGLPKRIQNILRNQTVKIKIAADTAKVGNIWNKVKSSVFGAGGKGGVQVPVKVVGAEAARKTVEGVFAKDIPQGVIVDGGGAMGQASALHANLQGIFSPIQQLVTIDVQRTVTETKRAAEAHSPSRLFMREVGVPIGQGIALGATQGYMAEAPAMVSEMADITAEIFTGKILEKRQEVGAAVIELFAGGPIDKAIERLEKQADKAEKAFDAEKFVPNVKLMKRDLMASVRELEMFNRALRKLERRGAPVGLVEALRSMGPEHARKLKALANATEKELNRYIRAWKRAEKAMRESAAKIRAVDLRQDLQAQAKAMRQWNADMARLARRGVPAEFLAQLRELGIEGAVYIHALATASVKELKKIIKAWKELQKQIAKANQQAQTADLTPEDREAIQDHLTDLYTSFAEEAGQAFGQLFAGGVIEAIMASREAIRSAVEGVFGSIDVGDLIADPADFEAATKAHERERRSILRRIAELNKESAGGAGGAGAEQAKRRAEILKDQAERIADVQKRLAEDIVQAGIDAIENKRQEMRSAFGDLFEGAYLASEDVRTRLEWGQILNMDDLTRDLQAQLQAFREWRANLAKIAAKAPAEFVAELEQLGPDAADKVALLANATDAELDTYVDLWREKHEEIEAIATKAVADTTKLRADADKEIAEIIADTAKQLADLASEVAQGAQDAIQDVGALMDELEELNQQLIDLDKNAPKALTFQSLLDDLIKRRNQVKDFGSLLQQLATRGAPQGLIDELAQMGADAIPILRVLVGASQQQLNEYIAIWKAAQADIETVSNGIQGAIDPTDLLADLHKQVDGFKEWEGYLNQLVARNVPQGLIDELRALGPDAVPLLKALVSMSDTELTEYVTLWNEKQKLIGDAAKTWMDAEIKKWYQFGKDIFMNWLKGANAVEPLILDYVKKLMKDIEATIKQEQKGGEAPPGSVMQPGGPGPPAPDVSTPPGGTPANPPVVGAPGGKGPMPSSEPTTVVHQTVYAVQDEALETTLEKASFQISHSGGQMTT